MSRSFPAAAATHVTPVLQEALDRADEEMAYHDRRMPKRIEKLTCKLAGDPPPPWVDEDTTGVLHLPDPFPPPGRA